MKLFLQYFALILVAIALRPLMAAFWAKVLSPFVIREAERVAEDV